jgi:hypothetical protein
MKISFNKKTMFKSTIEKEAFKVIGYEMGSPLCVHICARTNMGSPLPTSAPGLIGLTPSRICTGTKPPSLTPADAIGPEQTHKHTNNKHTREQTTKQASRRSGVRAQASNLSAKVWHAAMQARGPHR